LDGLFRRVFKNLYRESLYNPLGDLGFDRHYTVGWVSIMLWAVVLKKGTVRMRTIDKGSARSFF
jgi:hypothetical protein